MLNVGLVVVATVAVLLITQWIHKWKNPKTNGVRPPGSMGFPIIGETLQLFIPCYSLDLHPFLKKRFQKYGSVFSTNLVGQPMVISSDPELNQYIFAQEGKAVELFYLDSYNKIFNIGGSNTPGSAINLIHKYVRGVFLNMFGVENLQARLFSEIETTVRTNIQVWSSLNGGTMIDVKTAASKVIVVFAVKHFLGHDSTEDAQELSNTMNDFVQGFISFPINLPGTHFHKCMKDKDKLLKIISAKLKQRIGSRQQTQGDFLDQAVKDLNKDFFLTEDFFTSLTLVAIFATVESIALYMALFFKFFDENPWVVDYLKAENEDILNRREDKLSPLTWVEYKSMNRIMNFINEVLRLGNVFPGIFRKTLQDIPYKGYTIPKGWAVLATNGPLQINPKVFKEPLEFNPRRWEDIDKETMSKNFMPYGGGARQCVGSDLAKAFFATFLHNLICDYNWKLVKGGQVSRRPLLRIEDGIFIHIWKKHLLELCY